ncbi:alpha/beta hydrolase fold domain-containing protein [Vibrio sp.]|uniref:alpha/beta hydrolase fold domain-containing protein n=1 Tax=Vibrio sp. TaxID=678 RepID=UPI003D151F49
MKRAIIGLTMLIGIVSLVGCSARNGLELTPVPVQKQTIDYKTVNGKTLALDLYLPHQQQAAPLLVWVHGGAWMRGSKDEFFTKNGRLANTLLKQGYAVAVVNYRLSSEATFPAPVADINDAINYLMVHRQNFSLKSDRVVMMGRSAGAHLAMLVATSNTYDSGFYLAGHEPRYKVSAVVDFFGPSDLVELKGNSGAIDHDAPDSSQAKMLGKSPREDAELAKWASPTTYINNTTPPFIIFHGLNDTTVPYSQSEYLKSVLDGYGIENHLYLVDGAHHGDPIFDTDLYVTQVLDFIQSKIE